MLNEHQAWDAIVEKLEDQGYIHTGLCREVDVLFDSGAINSDTYDSMMHRIATVVPDGYNYIEGDADRFDVNNTLSHNERDKLALVLRLPILYQFLEDTKDA